MFNVGLWAGIRKYTGPALVDCQNANAAYAYPRNYQYDAYVVCLRGIRSQADG